MHTKLLSGREAAKSERGLNRALYNAFPLYLIASGDINILLTSLLRIMCRHHYGRGVRCAMNESVGIKSGMLYVV